MLGLLHGAQGCSTFIRLQLSRHFKESIALNSTAMSEDAAIFGGWENLKKGITRVIEKFHPGVVGVMTSGLTETMGDDVRSAIVQFREEHPEPGGDAGGLGLDPRLLRLAAGGVRRGGGGDRRHPGRGGPHHSRPGQSAARRAPDPGRRGGGEGDGRGLRPHACSDIPDISNALDGHVDDVVSPLSTGGIPVDEIRLAGRSVATIYVGDSLANAAARVLQETLGVPAYGFNSRHRPGRDGPLW